MCYDGHSLKVVFVDREPGKFCINSRTVKNSKYQLTR
jgi:hypothetical protein